MTDRVLHYLIPGFEAAVACKPQMGHHIYTTREPEQVGCQACKEVMSMETERLLLRQAKVCLTCHNEGGQVGHHPEQPCPDCGREWNPS